MGKGTFVYYIIYGFFRLWALLPLRILYLFSDLLSFPARGYRRKVIENNLRSSFPEMSADEIRQIRYKFISFLTDYFVETVKLSGMSRSEILSRMRFEGIGEINEAFAEGKSVVLYLGHYGNWEWISSLPLHFPIDVKSGQIYHPLENPGADRAFLKLRGRFGAISIKQNDTFRVLYGWKRDGLKSVTGFIADQAPGLHNVHLWVDFLNHDTPVFTGAEKMAHRLDAAVFYCDISRPRRGEYLCRMEKMSDSAASEEEFALTKEYYRRLEATIRRCPELWLWSHRRWKRTREKFNARYGAEGVHRLAHL
ncbi:MAG: lysophospholipid acyltransferase family protein [Clostridium sp.]|nr:lysophospholipid acyltransferase family protein [Clostridium sp.]MCM1475026.1 lysophospholipid acyltransferase family protein [Muribaculaceae bacterium]